MLVSYSQISEQDHAQGKKWYVYVKYAEPSEWFNHQTYVDALNPAAIREFIRITHEQYGKKVGDLFGKVIPAIFTDEPQVGKKGALSHAFAEEEVLLPWTTDFPDSFRQRYGTDLIPLLPELIWETAAPSPIRYFYHDHVCERFTSAFPDQCGAWCQEHHLMLTGHMWMEETLDEQTASVGEMIRTYRSFTLPGVDMLCDNIELATVKQAQSAAHQNGAEGVMSELYGATNWTFDFRGHKFQGDWQAALGVTVRVPHLSWVSMKGAAKRDYPASIHYQSPWYREYGYIEDHFARLNTALTRGVPCVDVAVIHPVESYWLHWGPRANTAADREELETNFQNIIHWLLFGLIDFDLISEAMLPIQCKNMEDDLSVGAMKYKTLIVPGCETLRNTTVAYLSAFQKNGGKVIFMGDCPKYVDAVTSDMVRPVYETAERIPFSKRALLNMLENDRVLTVRNEDGSVTDNLVYQLRLDGDVKWLFLTHAKKSTGKKMEVCQNIEIIIHGEYEPVRYDTLNGTINKTEFQIRSGNTYIKYGLYAYDSLLLALKKPTVTKYNLLKQTEYVAERIDFKCPVPYHREEPNVLLLDEAEYALDGGPFQKCDEILRIGAAVGRVLGYTRTDGTGAQPWIREKAEPTHFVMLRFRFYSEIETEAEYAFEEAEAVWLNGNEVVLTPIGWYVDRDIQRIRLPRIRMGENILAVKVPVSEDIGPEPSYLLGDFDVRLQGTKKSIYPPSKTIGFGSITHQGLPFYGGNLVYETEIDTPHCTIEIRVGHYIGALIQVLIDGKKSRKIVFPPYCVRVEGISQGKHKIQFILYGNRNNTFGSLHNLSHEKRFGPPYWYPDENAFTCSYMLEGTGIISSPVITVLTDMNGIK